MPEILDYTYQFHKKGGHNIAFFIIKRATGSTSYYQYISSDGYWYVMREVIDGVTTTTDYSTPVSVSTTTATIGWAGRAALTYSNPNVAFA